MFVTVSVTGEAAMLTTEASVRLVLLMANEAAVVAGPERATARAGGVGSVPDGVKLMLALALRVLFVSARAGVNEYVTVQAPPPATERPGAQDSAVTAKSPGLVPVKAASE